MSGTGDTDKLFNAYIDKVIGEEGAYSNDPNDSGGETMWGVTAAIARASGYVGPMNAMPRGTAITIYKLQNWTQPGFDKIAEINGPLGSAMLDLGINCGTHWPGLWLQRGLNVLSDRGSLYKTISVDGMCGTVTRASLNAYLAHRGADGVRVMLSLIRAFAAIHYVEIAEANPKDEDFEYGWLANRAFPV
jgi:lysozyme family protein